MPLRENLESAVKRGDADEACRVLAKAGLAFDSAQSNQLHTDFRGFQNLNLFWKCVVRSCEWAGFVGQDPSWFADGCNYFVTGVRLRRKYTAGFHKADPIKNLETWSRIVDDPKNLVLPIEATPANEVLKFEHDTFAALKLAEWRKDRSWLGPWTFHGAFKIYLIYRDALWNEPGIDAITLPTGGKAGGGSFEGGWSILLKHNLVTDPPPADPRDFDACLVRAQQLHAEVTRLASLAGSRALHVNSGIYLLGAT